jgi:hypothetical protein
MLFEFLLFPGAFLVPFLTALLEILLLLAQSLFLLLESLGALANRFFFLLNPSLNPLDFLAALVKLVIKLSS